MVLRFRGGRRNPPPIQRMEADDLMAAVFPQAAACQENVAGPIEIPDHVIVRQTIDDTLHEALDVDGLRALLERMESGDVHGALRRHHRAVGARARDPHRAAVRVPRRRGAPEPPHERGHAPARPRRRPHVDRAARRRRDRAGARGDHARPETADDLHDLLCSLVVTNRAPIGSRSWTSSTQRGRVRVVEHERRPLWCATELFDDAVRAFADDDDAAVTATVRGHLELAGITTVDELAATCGLAPGRVALRARGARTRRVRAAGPYTDATRRESSGWRAGCSRACTRTPRRTRRQGAEPATAQDFMRFLLRWQHLAPGTQLAGDAGLATVVGQLQGWEAAAVGVGTRAATRAGCGSYDPAGLDRLCHDGEVALAALEPARRTTSTRPRARRTRRRRSRWCSATTSRGCSKRRARGADPVEPRRGRDRRDPRGAPRASGACFAAELAPRPTGCPKTSSAALWSGVTRGLLSSDGFGAIRRAGRRSARRRPTRPRGSHG